MADRILADEFVDFADLPPAKLKQKQVSAPTEGNILLVQSSDLLQHWKPIGDLTTWLQCVDYYMAVVTSHYPARVPNLIGYMLNDVRASQKYKWQAWLSTTRTDEWKQPTS